MKRKNLTVIKKVEKKSIHIKNQKIKKIYSKFKEIILRNVGKNSFAVAVSGGADSLCLATFSYYFSKEIKKNIFVLIVDHKLRKESNKEALKVKAILKKKKISSEILVWKGKIPKSNVQKNARNIRYSLISNYCKKKNIKHLITAHHMDDQIENFFIRLLRGSGLTGLSSMSESFEYSNDLKIIRPFLKLKKTDLKYVTQNFFKTYIEDPSNKNEKYLRVRVRKYRKIFEDEGLDTYKIIKTINNLLQAKKALSFYKNKALYKHVSFVSKNKCMVNKELFIDEAAEIVFKSFSDIFSLVSGTYYPPRSKKIINLIRRLNTTAFKKSTLGGCVIEKKDNFFVISKEQKIVKLSNQPQK